MIEAIGVCRPYECFDVTNIQTIFEKARRNNFFAYKVKIYVYLFGFMNGYLFFL